MVGAGEAGAYLATETATVSLEFLQKLAVQNPALLNRVYGGAGAATLGWMEKQAKSYEEMTLEELIDSLPVLTPEEEALYDKNGNLIGSPENLLFGNTEPRTSSE